MNEKINSILCKRYKKKKITLKDIIEDLSVIGVYSLLLYLTCMIIGVLFITQPSIDEFFVAIVACVYVIAIIADKISKITIATCELDDDKKE